MISLFTNVKAKSTVTLDVTVKIGLLPFLDAIFRSVKTSISLKVNTKSFVDKNRTTDYIQCNCAAQNIQILVNKGLLRLKRHKPRLQKINIHHDGAASDLCYDTFTHSYI